MAECVFRAHLQTLTFGFLTSIWIHGFCVHFFFGPRGHCRSVYLQHFCQACNIHFFTVEHFPYTAGDITWKPWAQPPVKCLPICFIDNLHNNMLHDTSYSCTTCFFFFLSSLTEAQNVLVVLDFNRVVLSLYYIVCKPEFRLTSRLHHAR